jgi:sphingosine kinase
VYELKIHSFPNKKGWFSKPKRTIETLTLYTEQSKREIKVLHLFLVRAITNRQIKDPEQLKLLAYFNPAAGANSRKQLDILQRFMKYTNFTLEIFETQRKNHCREHLDTL